MHLVHMHVHCTVYTPVRSPVHEHPSTLSMTVTLDSTLSMTVTLAPTLSMTVTLAPTLPMTVTLDPTLALTLGSPSPSPQPGLSP